MLLLLEHGNERRHLGYSDGILAVSVALQTLRRVAGQVRERDGRVEEEEQATKEIDEEAQV